jgi:hypothetical protein
MTNEKKIRDDWVLALSFMECMLFLILLVLLIGGAGIGAGYYLGSQPGHNQLNSVIGLAEDLSTAHESERKAIQVNYDMIRLQLARYEQFLLGAGIEPTLPMATKPPVQSAKASSKRRHAVGGP